MIHILLLHGPNLNLQGRREPSVYGHASLADLVRTARQAAERAGASLSDFQSNHEGEAIEAIHSSIDENTDFIIINPGAWTHTSIALRDALLSVNKPFIELHLSNVYAREPFRRHSYLSDIAVGVISGFGIKGYALAVQAALNEINKG